ncbi:hypothetical protein Aperf_G00000071482 [Anoplocephala perfoliata]
MSNFKRIVDATAKLHDRRERRKSAKRAAANSQSSRSDKIEQFSIPSDSLSDTASGSSDKDARSGTFEKAILKPLSLFMTNESRASLFDKEFPAFRRRHLGRLRHLGSKHRSQSALSLFQPEERVPGWMVELKIYAVCDINTAIVHTAFKQISPQLHYCGRKAGRFSTLGTAELSLSDCIIGVTYSKHLEIIGPGDSRPIGALRMQACLYNYSGSPISSVGKNSSIDEGSWALKSKLRLKQRSSSVANLASPNTTKVGPLKGGVQIFEARYLGLLGLNVVTRPCNIYARRWKPLQYQPGEVAVITNPLTKATETVSPRLSWPPNFLRGVSALEFDPITGPQVAQFDSAMLYIHVLSACGLQSIPVSKFLRKYDTDENHGVTAARVISYFQSKAKKLHPISTQVQLRMGKDKYLTSIRKSTFDPVWNQIFTYNLSNYSNTLIEIQLLRIANPNIIGPAAGIEKIGEGLIDISRLPMDFTQRIEIELNGKRPKPRLLLLATLTGLTKWETRGLHFNLPSLPSIKISRSGESNGHQSDTDLNIDSTQSIRQQMSCGGWRPPGESISPDTEEWSALTARDTQEQYSLDETDAQIVEHYSWKMALKDRYDVGFLRVNVIAASGLADRDSSGKCDCDAYCMLELINMRAQTQTVKKEPNPKWDKVFVFPVTDIHTALYITVYDDEKNRPEFIGRVAIPLIKFKAAWRTLNPIEASLKHPLYPEKYKKLSPEYVNAMRKDVIRLKAIFKPLISINQIVESICAWEKPWCTILVLIGYNAVVWNFQPYMIPLGMVIGILACYQTSKNSYQPLSPAKSIAGIGASAVGSSVNLGRFSIPSQLIDDLANEASSPPSFDAENEVFLNNDLLYSLEDEISSEDENRESEKRGSESKEKKHGKKKFNAVMDVIGDLPQILDLITSAIERTIGIFEWQVPWLTWLCLFFLVIFTILLYFVPYRIVFCIIGTNQLTRKLLRPSSRHTFFAYNVISRVPSRPEIVSLELTLHQL